MRKRGTSVECRRNGKRWTAVALVTGYLLIVLLGCFAIWAIPIVKNQDDLLLIAADKGKSILTIGQNDEVVLYGMEHWFFDEQGRVVSVETAFLHKSQQEDIRSYADKVLEHRITVRVFAAKILTVFLNGSIRRIFLIILRAAAWDWPLRLKL